MPRMTSAEYDALLARTRHRKQDSTASDGVKLESELHQAIFSECRRRGWIAFHGSMSERTHRTLSEPDFIIATNDGRTLYVECKSKTGKLSTGQAAMGHHLSKNGQIYGCVRSISEFLELAS